MRCTEATSSGLLGIARRAPEVSRALAGRRWGAKSNSVLIEDRKHSGSKHDALVTRMRWNGGPPSGPLYWTSNARGEDATATLRDDCQCVVVLPLSCCDIGECDHNAGDDVERDAAHSVRPLTPRGLSSGPSPSL
jgi:hypothetical protein